MIDSPIFTRRQLGQQLRTLRLQSTKTAEDVEIADIMSSSKMYKIEAGKQPRPSWPEIQELGRLYDADDDHIRELVRMAQACLNTGWYVPFDIPLQFQSYLDLEGGATRLRFVECEVVNGLFQTEAYLRAVQAHRKNEPNTPEQVLGMQLQRIRQFWGRNPAPVVELIMSETVLRRLAAEPEVISAQLDRLRELAALPNVSVYVLPFSAGFHPAMDGAFTLMEFASGVYPDIAYVESRAQNHYHEREPVVALYNQIYSDLIDVVVPLEEFEL